MKKLRSMIALFLSCIILSGCGGQEDSGSAWSGIQTGQNGVSGLSAADRTEYYDIVVESESIFQWDLEKESSPPSMSRAEWVGMQFYQGEPVQLWKVPVPFTFVWDICVYRSDGSKKVILPGVDYPSNCHGYLDQDGNLYWWKNTTYTEEGQVKANTFLKKYLASGEVLFDRELDRGQDILEIRQTADGRMYLTIQDTETRDRWLAELDSADGHIAKLCAGQPIADGASSLYLGTYGDKPVVKIGSKITEINGDGGMESEGTSSFVFSFAGTSYTSPQDYYIQDFRVLEDESLDVPSKLPIDAVPQGSSPAECRGISLEFLWSTRDGCKGIQERLRLAEVGEKTLITLRAWGTGSWLDIQIDSFNRQSDTYHVVLEDGGPESEMEDFARLTSVQIASGKGPDILLGGLMREYMPGMIEKGALEDLRPYMEESGIREEDYFPYTFGTWRNGGKIYGVCAASPGMAGYHMDGAVLGGMEEPDIKTLVDALLARQEDAIFLEGYDSQELLAVLLKGTDTLWGMIDWEKGSCDFGGELFAGILEMAKRYGDNDGGGGKTCIAKVRKLGDIFHFDDTAERERDGKVICGVLFDDGCHAAVTSDYNTLAVNANSSNKEGAWEFISFLLGDKAQSDEHLRPAGRKAFDMWVESERARVADGRELHELNGFRLPDGSWDIREEIVFSEADITDEIVAEYVELLEDARPYPLRTVPILEIIREEAADYFSGSKSAEAVSRIIANRVQLYLDEGR